MSSDKKVDYLEEISKFVFTSKYSKYREDLNRRETWEESVDRLTLMHLKHYNYLSEKDKEKVIWAFDLVKQKRVAPSMRSLQFGGKAIETKNEKIYNCAVRHIDSLRSFAEIEFLLLNGCGVGIGLSKKYLNRLPDLVNENDKTGTVVHYVVEDTIEGWSDSIEALLMCFFKNTPYTGRKIVFDYSRIRKRGEPLKTTGGKAPGYKGLKNAHSKIKELLDHAIEYHKLSRMRSIDAYDIVMHSSDAVLSGGVRRSAVIAIFDKDDADMLASKTYHTVDKVYAFSEEGEEEVAGFKNKIYEGRVLYQGKKYDIKIKGDWDMDQLKNQKTLGWWHINPQRARSNNSVLLIRDQITKDEFKAIVERTKQFGEPGFIFTNNSDSLLNPCCEINFIPVTDDGVCGVQFCNLTTINGRLTDTVEKFREHAEASAIIGTLQAGYTNFKYLSSAAKQLTQEEALLGCSITGFFDNPKILLDPKNQKEMAELSKKVNLEWSKKININPAARVTAVKPEGTASLVLGTGSGIHPHHSKKYFRRVQCNKIDNVYKFFKKQNPHMCSESVWSANKTDDVITFPINIDSDIIVKKDLTAIKHLEHIKSTQKNWVITGTSEFNKKDVTHNVSCTVVVGKDEWEDVINYLYENKEYFSAVSLLGASGDKDYQQAPMESVTTENDEKIFKDLVDNMKIIDYTTLKEEEDKTTFQGEIACAGGNCEIVTI
jgi:ribonucleoside-triphosphate reductase (thioredoxin)